MARFIAKWITKLESWVCDGTWFERGMVIAVAMVIVGVVAAL